MDIQNRHFYFVAICDVNEAGKPMNQGGSNIDSALNGLIESIGKFGHCDDLCTPIIGTGRAIIKEATIDNVFQRIVNSFINSDNKILRKLIIS